MFSAANNTPKSCPRRWDKPLGQKLHLSRFCPTPKQVGQSASMSMNYNNKILSQWWDKIMGQTATLTSVPPGTPLRRRGPWGMKSGTNQNSEAKK